MLFRQEGEPQHSDFAGLTGSKVSTDVDRSEPITWPPRSPDLTLLDLFFFFWST